jgi:uncharacterized protein
MDITVLRQRSELGPFVLDCADLAFHCAEPSRLAQYRYEGTRCVLVWDEAAGARKLAGLFPFGAPSPYRGLPLLALRSPTPLLRTGRARAGWSRVIARGDVLRLVDLEGRQAVDFLCYNAADPEDRYAAADTMKINGNIFIRKGTVIYSVNCNPMFTVIDDTCGFHDTIGGCCSSALNRRRYGKPDDPNCRQNFLNELARYGMGPRDIVANMNFFMYVPVAADGAMDMGPGISKSGDYVELRAEMDVLAVISNCPQVNNPVNDFNPTPVRALIYRGETPPAARSGSGARAR